jgi:hypothetical protein
LGRRDWDEAEVLATVEDYFDMLLHELRARPYSKAEHRRQLMRLLSDRSDTAVERKHMNISAILRNAGLPFIEGYKPLGSYQELLARVVRERLAIARPLIGEIVAVSQATPSTRQAWRDADPKREVPRPEPTVREKAEAYVPSGHLGRRFDFPERDAANRRLGELGERFVVEVEKKRLRHAGRGDLAKRVRWVSKEIGDGAGYDIQTFDVSGSELLVEVKTTNLHRRFPFVATRNEVRVSEASEERYRLYRLFQFARDPRFFILPGALSRSCILEPRSFTARV